MESERMSFDERYLLFRDRTAEVFREFPELEAIRFLLFRQILLGQKGPSIADHVKHWLRPALKRGAYLVGQVKYSDVLVWVEGSRQNMIGQLKPVVDELRARGVSVLVVGYGAKSADDTLDVVFKAIPTAQAPKWAPEAWGALVAVERGFTRDWKYRAFRNATGVTRGVFEGIARLLDLVQPGIVLMAAANFTGGSALAVSSQRRGIWSCLIQHGITQAFYTPVITDTMFIWGVESRGSMMALGVPGDQLVVAGSPHHDSMKQCEDYAEARRILLETLGLPQKPTFTFFSNGNDLVRNGSVPAKIAQWLECLGARLTGRINVVVRLHPNEDETLYRNCGHVTVTKDEVGLDVALGGSDWIGSLCSTALYEALLHHKPVWHFDSDEWPELARNWREGLAVRVASGEDLLKVAERSLEGLDGFSVTQEMIHRVFSSYPNATLKVADFVEEMLSKPQKPMG